MASIVLDELTVEYRSDGRVVRPLDGLGHRIDDGSLVVLLGPSGSGKTTLLSCLGGLLRPTSGRVSVSGVEITSLDESGLREHRRSRVGFVFQAYNLIASLDARDNVAAPLIAQGVRKSVARARAESLLTGLGLGSQLGARPGKLSGGQQQRVAVARGIVHDPDILLADEPTANLDDVQANAVIDLVRDLARPGRIVVVSTHDDRFLPAADDIVDMTPSADGTPREPSGPRRYSAGDVIFSAGDRGSLVYIVDEGEVVVEATARDGSPVDLRYRPGEYFGELGPMLGQRRSSTARAAVGTRLTAMTLPEFRVRSRTAARSAQAVTAPAPPGAS